MAKLAKFLQGVAGAAGGAGLDIDEVFSTYLYTGTGSAITITNGINLADEGGLVWLKNRGTTSNHSLHDTERTPSYQLVSNSTAAEDTLYGDLTSFNSDGFSLGTGGGGNNIANTSAIASWSFRKAPKFFDVVTYTGDASDQVVSHSLGSIPGCIIIKATSTTGDWTVYHRGLTNSGANHSVKLNTTAAQVNQGGLAATDSTFTLYHTATVNSNNVTYVAYLFAHNDGDGEFGPDGDQDIIKCGSYTGNSGVQDIDLGFEPQWILVKNATSGHGSVAQWGIYDVMRGMPVINYGTTELLANNSSPERTGYSSIAPNANGFTLMDGVTMNNQSPHTYIYIAIRRGPLAVPEDATEVFAIDTKNTPEPAYDSGFVVDFAIQRNISVATSNAVATRLIQKKRLLTDSNSAEENSTTFMFDYNTGYSSDASNNASVYSWMWKRAPGFFDVVAYTGAYGGLTIDHNLGVVPEMMWVKARSGPSNVDWVVYHKDLGTDEYLLLNGFSATQGPRTTIWSNTRPTDSVFTVGGTTQDGYTSSNNYNYIAYLFASAPGVSKVGSYTGNGTSQNIDCGFSSGARFVLCKRTDNTSNWLVFDTARGINAGNDPVLKLDLDNAGNPGNYDLIDPHNSGFTIVDGDEDYSANISGASYIFYAIA